MAATNLTPEHIGELKFAVRQAKGKAFRNRAAMVRKFGDAADLTQIDARIARLDQLTTWLKHPKDLGAKMLVLGACEEVAS